MGNRSGFQMKNGWDALYRNGLAVSILLSACGGSNEAERKDLTTFNSQNILILKGHDTLTVSDQNITGTGSFIFVNSLGSVESGANFDLSFALEEGGSITLKAYTDENGQGGVEYTITRAGEQLAMEYASAAARHDLSNSLPKNDPSLSASSARIWIDVHNNEFPLHTLVWSPTGLQKESIGDGEAFFNSESLLRPEERESGRYTFPSQNGNGRFWAVELKDASITSALQSEPLYKEGEE